ncbi:alpha/beta fold hydrolase (plasmid) [Streptomyces sp. NBC_01450]|uniref:thioesterase II family protein n=1 Tax=Streptomyces sp. NBC_01450 TaxID=2903871 RepID=UPI002E31B1F1|nr:alpha/beta fold hydrolase [Streptomyces sp. NBC_01450]
MSDEPPVRLYCFAHSGETFDHWAANVGAGVEPVQVPLPGHGRRRSEPRVRTHEALLADLLPGLTGPRRGPFVLYGHGLGAMVALAVTRALHEAGLPGPALLAVGAWPPPHEDADIWLRTALPVLHTDLVLARSVQEAVREPLTAGPLATALLAVASEGNALAPPAIADGWCRWTEGPTWLRTVPGRHFFVRGRELPRLLGRACRITGRLARRPAPVV